MNYTQEFARRYIAKKFREVRAVNKVRFDYEREKWMPASFELPIFDDDFVLLTPMDMLTKDDIWISRSELVSKFKKIASAVSDDVLRAELNNYFQNKIDEFSKKEDPSRKDKTKAINETIRKYPAILDYFIKNKEETGGEAENLSSIKVDESKRLYLKQFSQLASKLSKTTTFYDISPATYANVVERLKIIQNSIEKDEGNLIFYFNDLPIQNENDLSILFRLTWKAYQSEQNKIINGDFLEILTNWKDSKKELKLILKSAANQQLIKTLDKLRDVYDDTRIEQKFILVIFYFSNEELNSVKSLLKALRMNDYKNIFLINLSGEGGIEEDLDNMEGTSKDSKIEKANQEFTNGYALLVGIGADLPVTVKDATALYDILINPNRAAYPRKQVTLLTETNAHRKAILDGLDKLIEQSNKNPDATVIVYYSGHGGKLAQENEYYLVPYGYDKSHRKETGITGLEFTEKIKAFKARKIIVFLDCCHAGGISSIKGTDETFIKSPVPPDLINALSSGSGRVIVASSHESEYSWTGNPYSVFTNYLIQALSGQGTRHFDGYAKILDILAYLFEKVPEHTSQKQHPFIPNITNLSDNFRICYYSGGSKKVEGLPESSQEESVQLSGNLTQGELARLEKRLTRLQKQYDILDEKINLLRERVPIESSILIKLDLEKQLVNCEAEISQVESQMGEIERILNLS